MTAFKRARRLAAAATLTVAAPLTAVVGLGTPASADSQHCPITFHWNGHGNISSTLWTDANLCGRPTRIKITCRTPVSGRTVRGNTVKKGASKATCNAAVLEGPSGTAYFEYQVSGKWWSVPVYKGSTTFYT
ncbi:hypothetical protein [Actinomadura atramentaria]|uniref:hypothetical protein n=1 Tax=Actinomadura atramentaria TaxID=1990 RepID=UPI00037BF4F3|nr:hypothetical protein [Actinomadura atramentaria]